MRISLVPARSYEPEILDRPDNSEPDLREAFGDIARINRRLGGIRSLWRPLRAIVIRRNLREFTLLDVGTGGGEVPRAIVERAADLGLTARAAGLDLDPGIVRYARSLSRESESRSQCSGPNRSVVSAHAGNPGKETLGSIRHMVGEGTSPPGLDASGSREVTTETLAVLRADAFRMPFADASFDFVTSSLMAHHFTEPDVSRLLAEMARVARHAVLLNDLTRHLVPWLGIRAFGIFLRSPMVRHDGPLSVLRGWTAKELAAVASAAGLGGRSRVERRFPYRLVLIVTKDVPASPQGSSVTLAAGAARSASSPSIGLSNTGVALSESDTVAAKNSGAEVQRGSSIPGHASTAGVLGPEDFMDAGSQKQGVATSTDDPALAGAGTPP